MLYIQLCNVTLKSWSVKEKKKHIFINHLHVCVFRLYFDMPEDVGETVDGGRMLNEIDNLKLEVNNLYIYSLLILTPDLNPDVLLNDKNDPPCYEED